MSTTDPTYCTMNDCGRPATRAVVFRWFDDDDLHAALYVCDQHLTELTEHAATGAIQLLDVRDVRDLDQPPTA